MEWELPVVGQDKEYTKFMAHEVSLSYTRGWQIQSVTVHHIYHTRSLKRERLLSALYWCPWPGQTLCIKGVQLAALQVVLRCWAPCLKNIHTVRIFQQFKPSGVPRIVNFTRAAREPAYSIVVRCGGILWGANWDWRNSRLLRIQLYGA